MLNAPWVWNAHTVNFIGYIFLDCSVLQRKRFSFVFGFRVCKFIASSSNILSSSEVAIIKSWSISMCIHLLFQIPLKSRTSNLQWSGSHHLVKDISGMSAPKVVRIQNHYNSKILHMIASKNALFITGVFCIKRINGKGIKLDVVEHHIES